MNREDPWPDLDFTVLRDQREKQPWNLGDRSVEATHLETGDYTVSGYEDQFAVERKSLEDLANSMGNHRDRFEDECRRARSFDHPLYVLIEDQRWKVAKYMKKGHSPHYYSQLYPATIINTIPSWESKYNVRFFWSGSRDQAAYECLYYLGLWYLEDQ